MQKNGKEREHFIQELSLEGNYYNFPSIGPMDPVHVSILCIFEIIAL